MGLKVKEADETITSSTTLQDDDELLFAVAANEVAQFEGVLILATTATPDFKLTFIGPTGAVGGYTCIFMDGSGNEVAGSGALGEARGLITASTLTSRLVRFWGGIHNGANAGNLTLQWAQNTSDGSDTTVRAGSCIKYEIQGSSAAPTAAEIADAVWDEAQADHVAAGSFGLVASEVADILVDTGTTLQAELDGIQADTEDIQSRLPAALVGGRIDATVDATGMEAGAVDAILDEVVEGTYTFRQFLRLLAAALGGKLSGAATTTIVVRDASDTKTRISATVDADGNRSAVTLDLT